MEEEQSVVTVQVMDRNFQVKCPKEQTSELKESAEYLDKKMQDLRENGKVLGPERIAVMAALNIVNDLLKEQNQRRQYMDTMSSRIHGLRAKIENALND